MNDRETNTGNLIWRNQHEASERRIDCVDLSSGDCPDDHRRREVLRPDPCHPDVRCNGRSNETGHDQTHEKFQRSSLVSGFRRSANSRPFKTQKSFFQWAFFHFDEHYTTHLDSTDHYLNNDVSANSDKRSLEEYTLRDIIGPVVYIDISARVTKELAKNDGKPSPNPGVTNFGEATGATVLASDIEQVADKIVDPAWIVVYSGWDKNYGVIRPRIRSCIHINGLNYPGFGKAAVKKLIEIENRKGIRINGIAMDNLSIDPENPAAARTAKIRLATAGTRTNSDLRGAGSCLKTFRNRPGRRR